MPCPGVVRSTGCAFLLQSCSKLRCLCSSPTRARCSGVRILQSGSLRAVKDLFQHSNCESRDQAAGCCPVGHIKDLLLCYRMVGSCTHEQLSAVSCRPRHPGKLCDMLAQLLTCENSSKSCASLTSLSRSPTYSDELPRLGVGAAGAPS